MVDITIVNGVYKPTYNWGAPSCMEGIRIKPQNDLKPSTSESDAHVPFFILPRRSNPTSINSVTSLILLSTAKGIASILT
jgi:hypothetical protein